MMKIAEINTSNYGSTGKIMLGIADILRERGDKVLICYPATKKNLSKKVEGSYIIGNRIGRNLNILISKIFGCDDLLYRRSTKHLVRRLGEFGTQAIHLHNLHGWYLNVPILFRYIKKNNIKVVWTLHDCWAITGHCPYFDVVGCEKWETECSKCPQHREYPDSFVDNSSRMHLVKKSCFLGVSDMTIVTPSRWLADIVKQSYLRGYYVSVINNGIDLTVFKPRESNFKQHYNLQDKKIVLGVAFGWGKRKGLDVFIRLASDLDAKYKVVLVGTDEHVDKLLPENILSIHRTHNQSDLAKIYTAADVFVNPTREDNFPTVNIEALACGTPIVTFRTGGSPEALDDTCGIVVEKNDYDNLLSCIHAVGSNHTFNPVNCCLRARLYDATINLKKYQQYL